MEALEIVRCPPALLVDALALVLCDLAPSQRRELGRALLEIDDAAQLEREALFIALRGDQLRGAAWGQCQPGNFAVFWPPQLVAGEDEQTEYRLASEVIGALDKTGIDLVQSLLPAPDVSMINVLRSVGFRHLADLLYLTCEAARFPLVVPEPCGIEFEAYATSKRDRLIRLVDRTYEGTLDCAALDGVRDLDDVVSGYQNTGVFRAENWQFVRSDGEDVGVLLLADHPQARHWELMYMGLVPEVRGRGWGRQVARYAQWLGRSAAIERILVAVDAANTPAADAYRSSGFEMWDRRSVYLRFPAKSRD